MVTELDLQRARQIVSSLAPLKGLNSDDADIVARIIAQSFAEGRQRGLDIAKDWDAADWRRVRMGSAATSTASVAGDRQE